MLWRTCKIVAPPQVSSRKLLCVRKLYALWTCACLSGALAVTPPNQLRELTKNPNTFNPEVVKKTLSQNDVPLQRYLFPNMGLTLTRHQKLTNEWNLLITGNYKLSVLAPTRKELFSFKDRGVTEIFSLITSGPLKNLYITHTVPENAFAGAKFTIRTRDFDKLEYEALENNGSYEDENDLLYYGMLYGYIYKRAVFCKLEGISCL